MKPRRIGAAALVICAALGAGRSFAGCEIQLRATAVAQGSLVRLGTIATVIGLDAGARRALEQMIIAPAPTPSGSRTISAAQLRRWLKQHGVETEKCRMTGSPSVTVLGRRRQTAATAASFQPARTAGARTPTPHDLTAVKQRLVQAVRKQLATGGVETADWSIDVDLPRRALWSLPAAWTQVHVEGLRSVASGKQDVTARFDSSAGAARIPVTVQLRRAERVVVAVRPLARGDVIGPDDVALRRLQDAHVPADAARDLTRVVGREAKQMIGAGHVIATTAIRLPIVVRRRDVVDVVSRTGGIVVRRRAIATQDGSVGDIIVLESITNRRQRFSAQVTGYRSAAVFVSAPTVLPSGTARR